MADFITRACSTSLRKVLALQSLAVMKRDRGFLDAGFDEVILHRAVVFQVAFLAVAAS